MPVRPQEPHARCQPVLQTCTTRIYQPASEFSLPASRSRTPLQGICPPQKHTSPDFTTRLKRRHVLPYDPQSSVFRAAAVALRLPRLLPKVPEGYWQNFWPERQVTNLQTFQNPPTWRLLALFLCQRTLSPESNT